MQLAAKRADRETELPPRPFDSWFEVDTALALALRGYRLSAQVQVARKRIDLVVEGDDGVRLAVECDGDAWHGPEQYEQDMFRQRQLERAEWRFVRVRECFFYANEARAIDEVIAACDELGIERGGQRTPPAIVRPEETDTAVSVNGVPGVPADLATNLAVVPPIAVIEPASSATLGGRGTRDNVEVEVSQALLSDERKGPYTGYAGKDYPDPRTSPIANVREAVLDIIATDGPLSKASVYALYREGCPRVQRAGKQLKHAINSAIGTLQRMRKVVAIDEGNSRDPVEVVVRLAEQPLVSVRPRGARLFEGIPLSELATVFRELSHGQRPQSSGTGSDLQRDVLERFDLHNLTQRARARLADAEARAFDEEFWRRVQGGGGLPF